MHIAVIFCFSLLTLTWFPICLSNVMQEPILELVHVFFRHGSRTPQKSEIHPLDPLGEKGFQPFGYGQLTNIGKQGAYRLGKLLHEKYGKFLGEIYYPDLVLTKSTDYVRTQMSALLVLAGLFPPTDLQKWDNELNWMPIPYVYEKGTQDYELRRPLIYCPVFSNEVQRLLKSESAQKVLLDHKNQISYMSQNTGKNLTQLIDVFRLYHTLRAEEKMNLTLPSWTKSVYPTTIHDIAVELFRYENLTPLAKRLNGGRMLKIVINNMVAQTKNELKPEGRKIFLYSAHEFNVVSMLSVMDLFDFKFPDYSSALAIELYNDTISKQHTVKVVYIRDVEKQPEELVIPECTKFCPLSKLIELMKVRLPNNYTEECESPVLLD